MNFYRLFCRWGDGQRWHEGWRFAHGYSMEHAGGKVEAREPGIEIVASRSRVETITAAPLADLCDFVRQADDPIERQTREIEDEAHARNYR